MLYLVLGVIYVFLTVLSLILFIAESRDTDFSVAGTIVIMVSGAIFGGAVLIFIGTAALYNTLKP